VILWLLAVGLVTILGQVVLLRELNVAFYGSELIYVLAMGTWLLWTAVGAAMGRRATVPSPVRIRAGFLGYAVLLPLSVVLARGLRPLFGAVPGAYLSFPEQIAGMALALLPIGLLGGLLFQWTAKRYVGEGRTLALAYGVESAGGLLGGVLATFLLSAGQQNLTTALLCGLAAIAAACFPAGEERPRWFSPVVWTATLLPLVTLPSLLERLHPLTRVHLHMLFAAILCVPVLLGILCRSWRREGGGWLQVVAVVLAVALLTALWPSSPRQGVLRRPRMDNKVFASPLDLELARWTHPNVRDTADSPYGRITLERLEGQLSLFTNDALTYESEGTDDEEFVHLAAIQVAEVRKVLVLGPCLPDLKWELQKLGAGTVHCVALNRVGERLFRIHRPPDERVYPGPWPITRTVADPSRYLEAAGRFDLILVAMPEPESAQANRFYTREFFARCREHLLPGGVLAFRLGASENLWTPALVRRTASIHRALRVEFDDVLVLPGTTNVLLASGSPLVRDPEVLAARWERRGHETRLVSAPYLRYMVTNDRVAEIEKLLLESRAPVNSDARPICYQYTLMLWLSRFFPVAAFLDLPAGDEVPWTWYAFPAAGAALLFLLLRRSRGLRRGVLVAMAGLLGMVLETVLILYYQVKCGVLYLHLGLLLALFMAGLAGGALLVQWAAPVGKRPARWPGAACLAALAGAGLAIAWILAGGGAEGLLATGAMLLPVGALTGAVFALASLYRVEDQRAAVSPLYAADVLGGCVGSLAATLLLIPLLGLPGTALLMALLAAACLLLL
jgi:spermidine synthase